MPTTWADGIRVRPSSAHTRTGMPASEGSRATVAGGAAGPPPGADAAPPRRRARPARSSCGRRTRSGPAAPAGGLAADRKRVARRAASAGRRRRLAGSVKVLVSGVRISTSVPSTDEVATAAEAIIWFMASDTADSSSSDSSGASGVLRLLHAHHRRGQPPRAVERHDEHVAAGHAVDVGDRRRDRRARQPARPALASRRTVHLAGATLPGGEHLEHAETASDGGLAEPDERVVGAHDSPPDAVDDLHGAAAAAAAGLGRVHGHLVGEEGDAGLGGRVEAQDVARLEGEHVLDRQLDGGHLGAHGHRRRRRRPGAPSAISSLARRSGRRRGRRSGPPPARSPTRGSAARGRGDAAEAGLDRERQRRLGHRHHLRGLEVRLDRLERRARDRPCRSRSPRAARAGARRSAGRAPSRCRSAGAPCAAARSSVPPSSSSIAAEHERALGAQQHARADRLDLDDRRRSSRRPPGRGRWPT